MKRVQAKFINAKDMLLEHQKFEEAEVLDLVEKHFKMMLCVEVCECPQNPLFDEANLFFKRTYDPDLLSSAVVACREDGSPLPVFDPLSFMLIDGEFEVDDVLPVVVQRVHDLQCGPCFARQRYADYKKTNIIARVSPFSSFSELQLKLVIEGKE